VGIVTGDFGNGRIDVATVNSSSNDVSVLMNQGVLKFRRRGPFCRRRAAARDRGPAISTGDGRLDLATANSGANSISVLAGLGGGAFASPVPIAVGAISHGADRGRSQWRRPPRSGLREWRGSHGNGSLGPRRRHICLADQFSANAIGSTPTLADVTGDGTPDSIVLNRAGQILVRPGRANEPGAFDAARIVNAGRPARAFTIVQLVGKRLIEAVDLKSNSVVARFDRGNGVATLAGQLQTDLQPVRIAAADLNGDGRQDLVVANAGEARMCQFSWQLWPVVLPPAMTQAATDHPTELTLVDHYGRWSARHRTHRRSRRDCQQC